MDVQKAIEWQQALKNVYNGTPKEVNEACDAAIDALKMRIPKKPEKNYLGQNICPECYAKILVHYNFCAACGQAIDWN